LEGAGSVLLRSLLVVIEISENAFGKNVEGENSTPPLIPGAYSFQSAHIERILNPDRGLERA